MRWHLDTRMKRKLSEDVEPLSSTNVPNDVPRETIIFDKIDHTYTIVREKSEGLRSSSKLTSVTKFLSLFIPETDPKAIISEKREEWKRRGNCEYNAMTDEQILKSWEEERDQAASEGTEMHSAIEYLLRCEMGTETFDQNAFDVMRKGLEGEMASYEKFRSDHPSWKPFAVETTVFDETLGISGTFDALFYDENRETFALIDWKRCKNIHGGFDPSLTPKHETLKDLNCGNYVKFMLQLCAYKRCIDKSNPLVTPYEVQICSSERTEKKYAPRICKASGKISSCFVVNFHENVSSTTTNNKSDKTDPVKSANFSKTTSDPGYQMLELKKDFEERYAVPFFESVAKDVTGLKKDEK